MATKKEEDVPEAEPQTGPTFLKDVVQRATFAEEAICKLRTEVKDDNFKFKDLGYLFPQPVNSLDYLTRLEAVVGDYLSQTARYGLSERGGFRTGSSIEENTSLYDFTVTEWMKQVYTKRKAEIDKKVEEVFRRISNNATIELRALVFDVCSGSQEIDRALAVAGRPQLSLEELAGKMYELKDRFYETELPRPEELAKLYEICFNAEVKQRCWDEFGDEKLAEALAQESVPLEMFAKYTEREIKLPKEKKKTGIIKIIDSIIRTPTPDKGAGAETALASRTGNAGSQRRSSSILILDSASAENNAAKSQEQWIAYWNNISEGRRFASMTDYYQVFKQLTDALQNGSPAEKASAEQSIASLRKDFQESYLLTSTRIIYQPNNLEARLIHGYGASNLQLTSERALQVPLYDNTPIASVYAAREGLTYLQALFNTEDSGQAIAERLSTISGYQPQDIKVWTPSLQSSQWLTRSQLSERAVGLDSDGRWFRLSALGHPVDGYDRSRGVR